MPMTVTCIVSTPCKQRQQRHSQIHSCSVIHVSYVHQKHTLLTFMLESTHWTANLLLY